MMTAKSVSALHEAKGGIPMSRMKNHMVRALGEFLLCSLEQELRIALLCPENRTKET